MRSLIWIMVVSLLALPAWGQEREKVLVRASKPYTQLVSAIEQMGGVVTYQFRYVDGLAAEVPLATLPALTRLVGEDNISKDYLMHIPGSADPRNGEAVTTEAEVEDLAEPALSEAGPQNYFFHNALTGASALHGMGHTGSGVVIAVIDSGWRPLFSHVPAARILAPGINLVPASAEPGGVAVPAISNSNFPHGTQVGGMAAANIGFCTAATSRLGVLLAAFGGGIFPGTPQCTAAQVFIPMVGGAPGALILPIKIFPTNGAGAPTSRTIAAMEAALDLRRKYEAGEPGGVNVQVVNMSLGGFTRSAGRSLSDAMVDQLLANDIVVVVSMGNDGFSLLTGGSPGTSFSALTVAAASTPNHERIVRGNSAPCTAFAIAVAPDCARAYRPDDNIQVVEFSSRGPTHDGRLKPDVITNGTFSFTQGSGTTATTINFASGTSFSAPSVAGIAALLRAAFPAATARQIRNAIILGANPNLIPTAGPLEQGAGYVDAQAAFDLLAGGMVPDTVALDPPYTRNVQANLARSGMHVYGHSLSRRVSRLRPAEVAEFPVMVPANAAQLVVRIRNITPELPLEEQNVFFTDDIFLRIQSSHVHRRDRRVSAFIVAGEDRTFTFPRPEEGIWRISPSGDWTNAGSISFDIDIFLDTEPLPQHTAKGDLRQGELHTYTIQVPAGTASLGVHLEWLNMWGNYPVNDVDAFLIPPMGATVNACATIASPERCTVTNPQAGTWTVVVHGFAVNTIGTPGRREKYTLRVEADGKVLRGM